MVDEVKVFLVHRKIGDHTYVEQICARSWAEAVETAAKFGATVDGELENTVCSQCGKMESVNPETHSDDWPDVVL